MHTNENTGAYGKAKSNVIPSLVIVGSRNNSPVSTHESRCEGIDHFLKKYNKFNWYN